MTCTRSQTIKGLKEEIKILEGKVSNLSKQLDKSNEDCHWLDDHRQRMWDTLLEHKITVPNEPDWDYGNIEYCNCSKCANNCDCEVCTDMNNSNIEESNLGYIDMYQDKCVEPLIIPTCCKDNKCEQCQFDIDQYTFPKTKITNDIKRLLEECSNVYTRVEKIIVAREIFKYLNSNYCIQFINTYDKFKTTVKDKLKEFYYDEGLKDAYIWYRNIFKERIP